MALDSYRQKRDFSRTPEPEGKHSGRKGRSFVIQKHDARRLHYDLRLEIDGVLKSWAVTRGPSLVPTEKRLAVQVEDHPLEYGDFEGTIPKGEYGGGTVLVWDRGRWTPLSDPQKGLAKGHLEFELKGEKVAGKWHLVRMARKPREKRENWLLIKSEDAHSREEGEPDILEEAPQSVKTGRQITEIAGEAPGWSAKTGKIERNRPTSMRQKRIKGSRKAAMPDFISPQLASLRAQPPSGSRWVHEIKFDGYRIQTHLVDGKLRLYTRGGLDWTDRFGLHLLESFGKLPAHKAILDGEIVVEGSGGASDFSALQADLSAGRDDRYTYYAFDLLYLDGMDLRGSPLLERKSLLKKMLEGQEGWVRYSEHFEEDGELMLRHACRLSLEGLVSKNPQGAYRSGRGRSWIKSKCAHRQELVIGGYTLSTTSKSAIGSLVLGVNEKGKLRHAGRVGTGFSRVVAEDLLKRLKSMEQEESPFYSKLVAEAKRNVRFVRPELVAEVEFRGWTGEGNLRHAAFRGLREDKPAREVVREEKGSKAKPSARPVVRLTHPDRIYWKDAGVTKEGLAAWYAQVWRWMAPHVANRPLALVRCPDGLSSKCFFQKHAWKGMNKEILTAVDPRAEDQDNSLIAIDSLAGLTGLVQGAALEIHPWQSSLADLEHPDQLILDLDPGEKVKWAEVVAAAQEVRERLAADGLIPFVKSTGGKGLHVVVPLRPKAGWDAVKEYARKLASALAAEEPDRFIAKSTKSARKGRIYVDYLRNGRGATAIAPYSTRAREGATVAMPLAWDEISSIGPGHFTATNSIARLENLDSDPWAEFREAAVPLPGLKGETHRKRRTS